MINKIIFLDLDGVLNHNDFYISEVFDEMIKDEKNYENGENYFCPKTVSKLNVITDETGAKIVFSSSHRNGFDSVKDIAKYLKYHGITGEVIGATPHLRFNEGSHEYYPYTVPRGCEILAWLNKNKDKLGIGIGKYRNYIILDDDKDMLYYQRNNYIDIDALHGLNDDNVKEAIKILNKNYENKCK